MHRERAVLEYSAVADLDEAAHEYQERSGAQRDRNDDRPVRHGSELQRVGVMMDHLIRHGSCGDHSYDEANRYETLER